MGWLPTPTQFHKIQLGYNVPKMYFETIRIEDQMFFPFNDIDHIILTLHFQNRRTLLNVGALVNIFFFKCFLIMNTCLDHRQTKHTCLLLCSPHGETFAHYICNMSCTITTLYQKKPMKSASASSIYQLVLSHLTIRTFMD